MITTRTTCPYCGVGCGILATPQPDGTVAIAGDPEHPANHGRLCSKGMALGETLSLDDRLLTPEIGGLPVDWEAALARVAQGFSEAIRDHGPDAVAFYVSGQLLTEDYYVANKLMKGFIGSANIDTNSRLCMASSVAGHRRAFGSDTVPGTYEDLEQADLVVLVGSNLAWCHPVLFQRLLAAREARGTRIVVVDPRRTATAEAADLHLALAPDSDVALFAGLLKALADRGLADTAFRRAHTSGAAAAISLATPCDEAFVAARTGLVVADVRRFFELFAGHERVVTVYSQGVNQSAQGTDKVNAILNCHLVTGRIGRPGMGPFSVTGQPNAMGGREVGGLANMLAAHMAIDDPAARERVQRFWRAPTIASRPGLKAIDLFEAVLSGQIKALWIMGTNPAVSMPDAARVRAALAACPFVVVSEAVRDTDTARHAHVLLPAATWGEKDGTVTNSERRISRQRAFLPLPGAARPDWAILAEVARRMGFHGFDYAGPAAVHAEHADLSGFENNGLRDFDISALARLDADAYDQLAPVQWPCPAGAARVQNRFFADGRFYTDDHRARLIPTAPAMPGRSSLRLNTGRLRDQWHTMTRTGKTPRLMAHHPEPVCVLHPDDAKTAGISDGSLLIVESGQGRAILRAGLDPGQRRGSVFAPMHWSDRFAGASRINAVTRGVTDPVSGQPALKGADCTVRSYPARWHAFAVSAERPVSIDGYWAMAPVKGGYRIDYAGISKVKDWQTEAARLLGVPAQAEWISLHDAATGLMRLAAFSGDRCLAALFVAPRPPDLARGVIDAALTQDWPGTARYRLLAGRGGADRPDEGALVCACQSVGINRISAAIAAGHRTVAAVGAACGAGTGCGSCRGQIADIIRNTPENARRILSRSA